MFCLGIAKATDIIKGVASGVGNPVYYVGAKTGRDGIHGATMASAEFDEKSAEKRPAVQVGDPFMEKLLLEACLEVMQTDALVGIQDMGAAGLTCSTTEMGSRGGAGVEIDVVARAAARDRHDAVRDHAVRVAGAHAARRQAAGAKPRSSASSRSGTCTRSHIGEVTDDGMLRVKERGAVVAEIPNRALTDEAPVYRPADRASRTTCDEVAAARSRRARRRRPRAERRAAARCSASPTIASKRWVYRQYDHMVRTNTIDAARPGRRRRPHQGHRPRAGDVGRRQRPLLLPRSVSRRDARGGRSGAQRRVRRRAAARRHQLPELRQSRAAGIMWQFAEAVEGIGDACRALDVPITGGNVSLYNETDGKAIYPTPVIGVVGLLEHADRVVGAALPGDRATSSCCSATDRGELGGSEYLKVVHDLVRGVPPALDLDAERALQALLVDAGGRAADAVGARLLRRRPRGDARRVLLRHRRHRRATCRSTASTVVARRRASNVAAALFGESASRVVVSVVPEHVTTVLRQRGGGRTCRRASSARPAATGCGSRSPARSSIDHVGATRPSASWSTAIERYFAQASGLNTMFDKFKDECGVFGIFGHPEAANMTYLGLYALQHRGQESAGIAASDGAQVRVSQAMGYVADVFDGETLVAAARARWRSATCATRPPARASCRTRSRS